jgi:REP-associated tyrosine transposase
MAHSCASLLVHCVFSTKGREPVITTGLRERLWEYIGGIARDNRMLAHAVGGTENHIHLLLSIPTTMTVSRAVQMVKGSSSRWVSTTFPQFPNFRWQEGYGAFTVSVSHMDRTLAYIRNQETHHASTSFEEEFVGFLNKHEVEYDEKYLWD